MESTRISREVSLQSNDSSSLIHLWESFQPTDLKFSVLSDWKLCSSMSRLIKFYLCKKSPANSASAC